MSETQFLNNNIDLFKKTGLQLEYYGSNTFIITGIPINLDPDFSEKDFRDVLERIYLNKDKDTPVLNNEMIKEMACKGSIRANQILGNEEVYKLLEELDLTENPYNCPHGRPTIIKLTQKEIEKMFKRIV